MRLFRPSLLPSRRARLRAACLAAGALALALTPADAAAQCISLTTAGSAYTQNFDTLSNTAGSTTNNLTISGWFMTESGGGARDNEQYAVDTGSATTGDTYSYGSAASTERAMGGLRSGTLIPLYGSCYTNNTGGTITSLQVAYNGEQWRLGTAARTDQINFEYSVNATDLVTGAWTGVPALNFVTPDTATTGAKNGNAAATRTALSSTISSLSIANGATFWIRWTDTDASGADDGLSVDDFSLTPNPGGPPPLSLSINDVALAEGNAGTTTFSFTVSLSAPANPGGVTFDIATADNTATTADNDYVGKSLTGQTIPAGNSSYTFDVTVNGDATVEANQTFFVNVTNVTGAAVADSQGQGTINNDDVSLTPIHDIQGPGASSPIVGASVTTTGVVTGVKTNGFFLQEPDATIDADPATSEGIFVFTSSAPPAAATVGNRVQVTGLVSEFVPSADPLQPPLTEITGPSLVLLSTGNPLPAPVTLTTSFPDPGGAHDQLERLEGMRVSVASLTVTGATMGNVNEPNATATSTGVFYGVVTGVPRPFREPGIQAPDPAPAGTIPPIPRFDSNPERIRVDSDGLVGSSAMEVGWGATVTGLVGPLDYNTRTYTVMPDSTTTPVVSGGPTPTPVTTPLGSEFTVASYNLERFFDSVNDPSIGEPVLTATAFSNRLVKASLGIRNYLKTPDIVGIVECENLTTLQALAAQISSDALAAAQPDPMYQAYLIEGNDVGGIDVGFLVKGAIVAGATPRVTVNSVTQFGLTTTILNPDSSADLLNDRPPLVLDAVINHASGATFPVVVIVNHLRSLLGVSDTGPGPNGWATAGDRVRNKRQKQAEYLANLVQARQIANPAEHIILVGDFNAFEFNDGYGDSMNVIAGTPPPDNETVVPGDGVDLVNPDLVNLSTTAAPSERYSYVFDGNAQSLDHALINAALSSDTLARREEHPRINGDFPETARNSTVSVTRLSDHDPIVTFFKVGSFLSGNANLTNLTLSSGTLAPAFASATTSYAATVGNAVASVTATPTAADAGATIEVQMNGGGFATVGSGTPSSSLALNVGTNTAEVKVTSEDASTTKTYSVAIHRCAAITLSSLPNGLLSAPYGGTIAASGGAGPYSYALTSGSLPSGLALNASDPAGFTGTPSATGTYSFQITATDTAAPGTCTGVRNYTVHIGSVVAAGDLVIREFRLRGPASATDEYVVVHSRAASPITIAATDGSAGFAVASSDNNVVFTIPNGTVIPARGHFLGVNTAGFSLGGAHDASWTTDIADSLGLALFKTATPASFTAPNALDAVGVGASAAPYLEGTALTSLTTPGEYAWVRKALVNAVQDTGANSADFVLVATNGVIYDTVQSVLGAPAPTRNTTRDVYSGVNVVLIEPNLNVNAGPNRVRVLAGGDRLEFRRRITNNTGTALTSLRLRFNELTTFNSPGYSPGITQADLRPGTSATVAIAATSIGATSVTGLTLMTPPAQPIGGGLNSVLTIPGGLAPGASVDINIALYVSRVGAYRFFATIEAQ